MKHIISLLSLVVLCATAAAQGPVVTIVNETGYTIEYLYVSSNQTDSWEDDVLGRNLLPGGNSFKITLPENGTYDFKGIDEDGDTYYKWNVIIRGNTTLALTAEDFEPADTRSESERPAVFTGTPDSGSTWVTVVNTTGYDIYYLYISLADADNWYGDILGETDILENGRQLHVRLPRPGTWDLKAVDEKDRAYTKKELPLTAGGNRVAFLPADGK